MSESNLYIKLEKAPELHHPGYPICGACGTEVELHDEWICPSCGTSWPSDNMEDDGSRATMFEDWAGEILTGPVCPNEFAWRVSDLEPDERDARIKKEITQRAEEEA